MPRKLNKTIESDHGRLHVCSIEDAPSHKHTEEFDLPAGAGLSLSLSLYIIFLTLLGRARSRPSLDLVPSSYVRRLNNCVEYLTIDFFHVII